MPLRSSRLRILNIDGTQFVKAFKRMGHSVLSIGMTDQSDITLDSPMSFRKLLTTLEEHSFQPDLVFWQDMCHPPIVLGIENLPAASIAYSVDQYCNPWHVPYTTAYDHTFVAQKDYVELFSHTAIKRSYSWAPLFCSPEKDKDTGAERDIPVSFVGTVTGSINKDRKPFLDTFKRNCPLFVKQGAYQPIFARSKIVLNQSAAGELNYRLFEAQACGAVILTEETSNGLTELYTPGKEILTYPRGNALAAAATARAALEDGSWKTIAASGKRKTLARHTVEERARMVLATAIEILSHGKHHIRLADLPAIRTEVRRAYAMIAVDEYLPLPKNVRELFTSLSVQQV